MGTRGYIVIIIKNKIFYSYNHFDSYPSGLGKLLTESLRYLLTTHTYEELIEILYNIKIVFDDSVPSDSEINELKKYADTSVSSESLSEWYCLLRKCQGNLNLIIESGYLLSTKFDNVAECISDNIDYTYVLNFNENTFTCNNILIADITKIPKFW